MTNYIAANSIIDGDSREILKSIEPNSIACSVWSPPYHVGKQYEVDMTYKDWENLLRTVICQNCRWHSNSYRSVDEFEYIYIFWKPGITTVDRERLSKEEWVKWGSRAVWAIPSVRANDDHEAKFPVELPRRAIQLLTQSEDLVLDCFVGSGTTAVAAILENRRYIGIDAKTKYVEMAKRACLQAEETIRRANLQPLLIAWRTGYHTHLTDRRPLHSKRGLDLRDTTSCLVVAVRF